MILSGRLKPDQRLVEKELADSLGISRTPVREAFRELVQIGLLVGEPYKGVRVAGLDLEEIKQNYEVRAEMEGFAAERAARRIGEEEIRRLAGLHELIRSGNGVVQLAELNEQFHSIILQAAGNRVLAEIITGLRSRILGFRMVHFHHPALVRRWVDGLGEVLEALRDRSPGRAREAMRQLIASGIAE